MALRNALEGLSTAQQQDLLLALLENQAELHPQRALQYARDATDQLRVTLSGAALPVGTNTIGYVAPRMFDAAGTYQGWYNSTVWNTVDQREAYGQQTRMEFQDKRARWTIT